MNKLIIFKSFLVALLSSSVIQAASFDLCVRRCVASGCMSQTSCEINCDGTNGFQPKCLSNAESSKNYFLQLASFNTVGNSCDWEQKYNSVVKRCDVNCESIAEGGPTDNRGLTKRGYCFHRCHNLAAAEADSACGR